MLPILHQGFFALLKGLPISLSPVIHVKQFTNFAVAEKSSFKLHAALSLSQ